MRWAIRSLIALLLIWAIYFVSPYVSVYGLAKALEARDVAAIEGRVNFRAVRFSIAKQLIPAYLAATGREGELKGARGQVVLDIGATIADPLLARYVSPEALSGFLSDPHGTAGEPGSTRRARLIRRRSVRDAWLLFATAETRGLRAISFTLPIDKPADEQFRLQMRLRGLGWRLVGVELPKPVVQRLVQELIKNNPTAT